MKVREYRVWDKFQRKMLEDEIGILPAVDHTGISFYECDGINIALINVSYESRIIMDFIGKKDKNGKKIFEGDIIKYAYSSHPKDLLIGHVTWNDEYAGYSPFVDAYPNTIINVEVIGNIYEGKDPI